MNRAYEPSAEEIQALVDGELSPDAAARVRAALVRQPRRSPSSRTAPVLGARPRPARAGAWWRAPAEVRAGGVERAAESFPCAGLPARARLVIRPGGPAAAALLLWMKTACGKTAAAHSSPTGDRVRRLLARRGAHGRASVVAGADRDRPTTPRAPGRRAANASRSLRPLARSSSWATRAPRPPPSSSWRPAMHRAGGRAAGFAWRGREGRPQGADADSDRAAIALMPGAGGALLAARRGARAAPRHVQATWNRALALDRLGMPLTAAEAFAAVAARGEAGWSQEASDGRPPARPSRAPQRGAGRRPAKRARDSSLRHGRLSLVCRTPGPRPRPLPRRRPLAPVGRAVRALRPLAAALDAVTAASI